MGRSRFKFDWISLYNKSPPNHSCSSSLDDAEMMNQAGVNDGLGAFSQFSEPAVDYFRTGERPDLYPNNNWH